MSSEYLSASETPGHQRGYSELSSSSDLNANPSGSGTPPEVPAVRRGRVRFNSTSEANDAANKRSSVPTRRDRSLSPVAAGLTPPPTIRTSPAHSRSGSHSSLLRHDVEQENPFEDIIGSSVPKPRPSVIKNNLSQSDELDEIDKFNEKTFSALAAQERAQRIATLVGSHSAPTSARTSLDDVDEDEVPLRPGKIDGLPVRIDDIPLVDMGSNRTYNGAELPNEDANVTRSKNSEAHELVRAHTRKYRAGMRPPETSASALESGHITPVEERSAEDYVPPPQQYRPGILSNLLKLYHPQGGSGTSSRPQSMASLNSPLLPGSGSMGSSPGTSTPTAQHQKWYHQRNRSQDTLAGLIEASNILGGVPAAATKKPGPTRPSMGRRTHSGRLIEAAAKIGGRPRLEDEIRITIHIAEILSRQNYLLKLCRALMSYGAPSHRLEEYMKMSARILETEGQFLYIPGCMIVSFDDASTHTTEVKLVKVQQGVDLGKLKDVHEIYKEVMHDVIGVEEAIQRLDAIMNAQQRYNPWILVIVYGFASASVAPYGKSIA